MQHTEQDTEQHTGATEKNTYTSTENSAHNYRTYSLDYYNEFAYIKNNDTIELYTILKDKVQKTLITSLYSFDFYHLQQYIKKLYNTAIYTLYTHYIHFARLINEVSKITNIDTYKNIIYVK